MSERAIAGEAIRPAYMAHFVLRTSRREELVAWYKTVLNAWEVFRNERLTFLTFDDEHHRLVIVQRDGLEAPASSAWGVAHIAYSFPSLRVLVQNYKRLRDVGILPQRSINHGPTTSFYYSDADGTSIELQTDNFATFEETVRFMNGPEFGANATGFEFDPEWLAAELEKGVPENTLKRRSDVPVRP